MKYPTLDDPLVVHIPFSIPSLKNEKRPLVVGGRVIIAKNPAVLKFQKVIADVIREQHRASGFSKIPAKVGILVYARIYQDNAAQDLDNQYTTLQEALFKQSEIIEDDRYVVGFFSEEGVKARRGRGMALLAIACSQKRTFSYYDQIGPLVQAVKKRLDNLDKQTLPIPSLLMED